MKILLRIISIILFFALYNSAEAKLRVDNSDSYVVSSLFASKNYAFIGAADGSLRIINPFSSKLLAILKCGSKDIFSISVDTSEEKLLVASKNGEITLWDIKNIASLEGGKLIKRIMKQGSAIKAIMLSDDGKRFYIALSNAIYEYDALTFHNSNIFDGINAYLHSISSSGSILAYGTVNGELTILDTALGSTIYEGKDFSGIISGISFASGGKKLLVCSYDKSAKLYDIRDNKIQLIKKISIFDSSIRSCSLDENAKKAFFVTEGGEALLYNIGSSDFLDIIDKVQDYDRSDLKLEAKDRLQIIASTISKDGSFLLFSNGDAYEEEHYTILYFLNSNNFRRFYLYLSSTLAISNRGYILGDGDFMTKIAYFKNGNKLTKADIIKLYLKEERFVEKR